jgi:hypothetical protein
MMRRPWTGWICFELLADLAARVRTAYHRRAWSPNFTQELTMRHDLARVPNQDAQELVFRARQVHLDASHEYSRAARSTRRSPDMNTGSDRPATV